MLLRVVIGAPRTSQGEEMKSLLIATAPASGAGVRFAGASHR
jgi:hypothetical protein